MTLRLLLSLTTFDQAALTGTLLSPLSQQPVAQQNTKLIIYYDRRTGKLPLLKAVTRYKATLLYQYESFAAIAVRVPAKTSLKATRYFEKVPGVLQVRADQVSLIQ